MSVTRGLGKDTDVLQPIVTGGLGRQPIGDAGQSFEYVGLGGLLCGGSASVISPVVSVPGRGFGDRAGRWIPIQPFPALHIAVGSGAVSASGAASVSISRSHAAHGGIAATGTAICELDRSRAIARMIDEDFILLAA